MREYHAMHQYDHHQRGDNPLAVVLVSGGLDSCVCLAEAQRQYTAALLHVRYGQRTEARELQAFRAIADYYGITKRLEANIGYLKEIGGSGLVDEVLTLPKGLPPDGTVPITYVPFRNAHLLSIAVSWAEVIGAEAVFIGAVEEDSSGYPDCREEFYQVFSAAVMAGTKPETKIEICTPLIHLTKADIVRRGIALQAPLHLTWSCYQAGEEACGVCESCCLRLRGFAMAEVEDPIPYRP